MVKKLFESRFWKSIFRHGLPNTERNRALLMMSNFFLHLHPVKVRTHATSFKYTLGLGGLSLYLFIVTGITGLFLMFYYVPATDQAYGNMKDLEFAVFMGTLMRNMHRWAAHGMVAIVFLHMCRVFYTGSYKAPREFNWLLGLALLVVTFALSYTGYLLPWDQLAYWGVQVGTNVMGSVPILGEKMRFVVLGGNIVDQNALIRFYVLHCFLLPGAAVIFMCFHFWRIRKDGGISGPPLEATPDQVEGELEEHGAVIASPLKTYGLMALAKGSSPQIQKQPDDTVDSFPHLVYRELIMIVVATVALLGTSYLCMAPLEEAANPNLVPYIAKAPWYFLGIQEMISWSPPWPLGYFGVTAMFFYGVVLPSLMIVILGIVPYLDRDVSTGGVWFHPARKRAITIFTLWITFMGVLILIGEYCRGHGWNWHWPWQMMH